MNQTYEYRNVVEIISEFFKDEKSAQFLKGRMPL